MRITFELSGGALFARPVQWNDWTAESTLLCTDSAKEFPEATRARNHLDVRKTYILEQALNLRWIVEAEAILCKRYLL